MVIPSVPSDFLSIKEFSAKVGAHPNTIRRAIKRGKLSAFKVGAGTRSHYRIAKTEIDRISLINLEDIVGKMVEKRMQENAKAL